MITPTPIFLMRLQYTKRLPSSIHYNLTLLHNFPQTFRINLSCVLPAFLFFLTVCFADSLHMIEKNEDASLYPILLFIFPNDISI